MKRSTSRIAPQIKRLLGYKTTDTDLAVKKDWVKRTKSVCKPCWELKYCPYGILVEQFPLPPIIRKEAIEHNKFLIEQISNGAYDSPTKKRITRQIREFDPSKYPLEIDPIVAERSCRTFGHICPVYFVNEPFTETKQRRRVGRDIPRVVMLRVVRRDDSTCQKCGKHLLDVDIEFDHIIPWSKGGSSDESNIRVTCFECNRKKSAKMDIFDDAT